MLDKKQLLEIVIHQLETESQALADAARAAHEAATHEESKAEDEHDTRGLEASYLAGAQANRAAEIKQLISVFRGLPVKAFQESDPIALGAVVELELKGRKTRYLIAPQGGGITVKLGGVSVQVITPRAPLGDALLGKRLGDEVEVEAQGVTREYEITGLE